MRHLHLEIIVTNVVKVFHLHLHSCMSMASIHGIHLYYASYFETKD